MVSPSWLYISFYECLDTLQVAALGGLAHSFYACNVPLLYMCQVPKALGINQLQ